MDEREYNASKIEAAISELESEYGQGFLTVVDHAIWGDPSDYDSFWARVREINEMFKGSRLRQADREELWARLGKLCEEVKAAHASQREQRQMLLNSNRDRIWQAIHNIAQAHNFTWPEGLLYGVDLKDFWADAQEVADLFRETKPLRRSDREELWADFQDLCQQARDLARARHEEWRERMEEHIDRWRSLIGKNEEVIERLKSQIEHCEDLKSNAKTEDFADQVQGWIDEKERIIDDIEARNAELWRKIEDVEREIQG